MSVNRISKFNYLEYKPKFSKQVSKDSELDTVGAQSLSEMINFFIARGELNKFLREQQILSSRQLSSGDITDEEISILNIKHLDRVEVNTSYNRLRARYLQVIKSQMDNSSTVTPSETVTPAASSE